MTYNIKVFLTGADDYQWALKEDYNQTIAAADEIAHFVELDNADIIHSVYWESLKNLPLKILQSKPVVCNLSGEWSRYEQDMGKDFLEIADLVDIWVVRSRRTEKFLNEKGCKTFYIPYTINTDTFKQLSVKCKENIRKKLKISTDSYVVGNFMRDSTATRVCAPKLVKGPDIFLEIVKKLKQNNRPVHVLLAGPRRHWIRKQLKENNVPFTYVGLRLWFDDMRINTLKRSRLNELYNILNLSLVTSRSEAGPHAILEAGAAQTTQLSSRVGIAEDVLEPAQIFESPERAVEIIERDISSKTLLSLNDIVYKRIKTDYVAQTNASRYSELYDMASRIRKTK